MKTSMASLLTAMLLCVPAFGAEKISVAVLDFRADGAAQQDAEWITTIVRVEVGKSGAVTVLELSGDTSCGDMACAINAGKKMGAHKVLMGSLVRSGGQLAVSCDVIDVGRGSLDFSEKERALAKSDEGFMAERLCDRIVKRMTGTSLYAEEIIAPSLPEKNDRPREIPLYRPARDPFCWIGVGFLAASSWGFFISTQRYHLRNFHSALDRSMSYMLLSWYLYPAMGPLSNYILFYSLADDYAGQRHDRHRAADLRNRGYYISAGVGGIGFIMLMVFTGRAIAYGSGSKKAVKPGDVTLVMPPMHEEPAAPDGSQAVLIGLGLQMAF